MAQRPHHFHPYAHHGSPSPSPDQGSQPQRHSWATYSAELPPARESIVPGYRSPCLIPATVSETSERDTPLSSEDTSNPASEQEASTPLRATPRRAPRSLPCRFEMTIPCKVMLCTQSRNGKQVPDVVVNSMTQEEALNTIFAHCASHIRGAVVVHEEDGEITPTIEDDDITFEKHHSFVTITRAKMAPFSLSELSDKVLDSITEDFRKGKTLQVKIFKYGQTVTKQTALQLEAASAPTPADRNRAGALTENARLELIAELKQIHRYVYTADHEQYWGLWATAVEAEKNPTRKAHIKQNLPASISQFFRIAGVMPEEDDPLTRQQQSNLMAYRAITNTIEGLQRQIQQLEGVRQTLWDSVPARPTPLSEDLASNVGNAIDFEHQD